MNSHLDIEGSVSVVRLYSVKSTSKPDSTTFAVRHAAKTMRNKMNTHVFVMQL